MKEKIHEVFSWHEKNKKNANQQNIKTKTAHG